MQAVRAVLLDVHAVPAAVVLALSAQTVDPVPKAANQHVCVRHARCLPSVHGWNRDVQQVAGSLAGAETYAALGTPAFDAQARHEQVDTEAALAALKRSAQQEVVDLDAEDEEAVRCDGPSS